jgi:hypothetical protein
MKVEVALKSIQLDDQRGFFGIIFGFSNQRAYKVRMMHNATPTQVIGLFRAAADAMEQEIIQGKLGDSLETGRLSSTNKMRGIVSHLPVVGVSKKE